MTPDPTALIADTMDARSFILSRGWRPVLDYNSTVIPFGLLWTHPESRFLGTLAVALEVERQMAYGELPRHPNP